MVKKTIKYKDFNGEEVTDDFFFHLSQAELIEIELGHKGGLAESMQKMIDAEDTKGVYLEFKKIIMMSYGRKSQDGKRFIKNDALREEFEQSLAYNALVVEFFTNTDTAIEFLNNLLPSDEIEAMATKIASAELTAVPDKPEPETMTWAQAREYPDGKELTRKIVAGEIVIVDILDS